MNKQGNLIRKHRTTLHLWSRRLVVSFMVFVFCVVSVLWAQGNAQSFVHQTAHAHGDGWQKGSVKSWVAVGTVTVYHYDNSNRQSQDTFPTTLIHVSDTVGGGGKGDKFQRLTFKAPEAPPTGSGSPPQNFFTHANRPDEILSREGTDGKDQWHSSGPLSTKATGRTQRLIESQTERSLEALFNFRKHGKNVDDVTARIASQGPNGTGGGNNGNGHAREEVHSGRSRAVPSFEAAKNKHVIEVSDPPAGTSNPHDSGKGHPTRYYIDDTTSLVTRMEFEYDTAIDPFSKQLLPLTEVYEFSEYRAVPGVSADPVSLKTLAWPAGVGTTVKFPFVVDRYINGQKMESMVFTQVVLNRNLRPGNFHK